MSKVINSLTLFVVAILLIATNSLAGPIQFNGPSNLHPTSVSMTASGDVVGGAWLDLGNGQQSLATYYYNAATSSLSYSPVTLPSGYQVGIYDGSVAQRHGSMVGFNLISPSGSEHLVAYDASNPVSFQIGPLDSINSFGASAMTQSGVSGGNVAGLLPAYGALSGTPSYLNTGSYVGGGVADATDVVGGTLFAGFLEDGTTGETLPVVWQPNGTFQVLPTTSSSVQSFGGLWIDDSGRYFYYISGGVLYGLDSLTGNLDFAKDSAGNAITGLTGAGVTRGGWLLGNGLNGSTFAWNLSSQMTSLQTWWSNLYGPSSASFIQASWYLAGVSETATGLAVALNGSLHILASDTSEVPEPMTMLSLAFGLSGIPIFMRRANTRM